LIAALGRTEGKNEMVIDTERQHNQIDTRGRVLIVDDEPAIRNILARILSNKGHQAQTVSSGKAALAMLREKGYDLLVADLKMSGVSGIDLYQTLKKKHPDMADRIVFITGDTMTEETNEFLASSGRPYLAKPFTPMEFLEMIEHALEGK
jgi:CheY-like chemotaxis protein